MDKVYLNSIEKILPRLFGLFDQDHASSTYGVGDRHFWGWKLIDFGNGTYQGAANGLARLLVGSLLPKDPFISKIEKRIDGMFVGTDFLLRSNGSLEEAFPYESSFCVTAQVAYDLLTAFELIQSRITDEKKDQYLGTIRRMIRFIRKEDENHGFISNHISTAAAVLYKWTLLTQEPGEDRGKILLNQILKNQSEEGWFLEYEGADPGYQTLCTQYLADLHHMRPDLNLVEPIKRSIQFLWHFAHPDGSFGGLYGSRNTRFFFPSGFEALANEIPEAKALAVFMRNSIAKNRVVTLDAVDDSNLIPMFNSYCGASYFKEKNLNHMESETLALPAFSKEPFRNIFPESGLIVERGRNHYTIISTHKGGITYHFTGKKAMVDSGVLAQRKDGRVYSTQNYNPLNKITIEGNHLVVLSNFFLLEKLLPTPLSFIILRMLSLTVMRNKFFRDVIKRKLVKLLITPKKKLGSFNQRTIKLGEQCEVSDELKKDAHELKRISIETSFASIHMASQGYWQIQDEKL
jgi:hypothetical protein